MKKNKKLRKLGDIMLDMEPLLEELYNSDAQPSDIFGLILGWTMTHRPDNIEIYMDNSIPILYTHKDVINELKEKGKDNAI